MKVVVPLFWKNASPMQKRVYSTIIILVIAILLVVIGSYVPISYQNANSINNDVNQIRDNLGTDFGFAAGYIFLHNFQLCLLMFIPVAGAMMGLASFLTLGIGFGAVATIEGYPVILRITDMVFSPVFWLEFLAYSIAVTESIWLLRRILQGRWRELKITAILVGVCAILLVIGALVEAWPIVNRFQ